MNDYLTEYYLLYKACSAIKDAKAEIVNLYEYNQQFPSKNKPFEATDRLLADINNLHDGFSFIRSYWERKVNNERK